MKRSVWLIFMTIYLHALSAQAKPLTPEQVPGPLKPWINWVLQDNQDNICPFLYNSYAQKRCSWPSRLNLELKKNKGQFTISWKVYNQSWISLPGNSKHWPLNVAVNGKAAQVMEKNGHPAISLTAGNYQISGDFLWDYIPENLQIPVDTGLIDLQINGKKISYPIVKGAQLWLKESDIGQKKLKSSENSLDIQVFRKIIDDVPLQVITQLNLEISGDQREVKMAHPLLENFIPIHVRSSLPARIEPDGSLLIQARPGRWQLEIFARHVAELKQLALDVDNKRWPDAEIWVFDARPYQRVVEIESLRPIDPSQTNLPNQWKSLPAYRVNQGDVMGFKIIRRGDPEPEPDQLDINRNLWLDFDGLGYTINDQITGKMTRNWRLNALPETQLGQVSLDGNHQLITRLVGSEQQGIEVRKGTIQLNADSRFTGSIDSMSVVGWEQNFHHVSADLNLPPGWRLFAASGIDNVPNSWISRWTLLDLFLVLIAALATARLWNVYWGGCALITLTLIWHEPGSPQYIWLNILAATALLKVLPQGKFNHLISWYRNVCYLGLVVIVIPFMIGQVRIGLYPQLEKPWQNISQSKYQNIGNVKQMAQTPIQLETKAMRKPASKLRSMSDSAVLESTYYSAEKSLNFDRIDPNANVQTGPGLPQWHWNKVHLSWNGAVDSQQLMKLWLLSPKMSMALNFIRVALIIVLSLLMFGVLNKITQFKMTIPVLLLPLILFMPVDNTFADIPDPKLLGELKQRLLEAPECIPGCAQISKMMVVVKHGKIDLELSVFAQQAVAVPLPAKYTQWFPHQVLVDAKPARGLYRDNNGKLWISLSPGRHLIVMSGSTPILKTFTLPLPLRPHRVEIDSHGWSVEGVHEHGIADQQLQFSKIKQSGQIEPNKVELEPGVSPPFMRIERTLQLGLNWRISNRVIRVSPMGSAVVLDVPLIPGESVTTQGVRVKQGKVLVSLSPRQKEMSWESVLEQSARIDLVAAQTNSWNEVWRINISPVWHLQTTGIAVVHHQDQQGRWLPEWRPWPGEKISLRISRPKAVAGRTLTIDNSHLQIIPGKRAREATLNFTVRSSQGTQHSIDLPDQAELQSVAIDGRTQPIRLRGTQLTLPIKPGKQQITVKWSANESIGTVLTTPQINLGVDSVNTHITIGLGEDRWLLLTSGPKLGPAVLFWGVLLVIVILSFGLGKNRLTPLKYWQWILLLIGLSQIPIESAIIVVAWFFVLGLKRQKLVTGTLVFNLIQVGIGLLTLTSLILLFFAVEQGLLGSPDMQITGNQSSAYNLNWYQDRSPELLPTAQIITVPLMSYRLMMLVWSLWLAVSMLNWLKWGWQCFATEGIWKKINPKITTSLIADENGK